MSPLPAIPPVDGKFHLCYPDGSHDVSFSWQPTIHQDIDVKTELMHFDGRPLPLAYFKEYGDETWDVEFFIDTVTDGDQFANLRAIVDGAYRNSVLVWTDVFGNQFNCIVSADPVSRDMLLGGAPGSVGGRPLGGRFQKLKMKVHRVT